MPKHEQDRSFYYFFALSILSALCLGFLLASCGSDDETGFQPEYSDAPATLYQWFSTTDEFTGRTFRCIESVRDYAIWCYEENTP